MYSYSYLNTAKSILEQYQGNVPFATWLKNFFKQDKKFGSKDRKQIAHLCYCYFRAGRALLHLNIDERIIWSLFLCSTEPGKLLEGLNTELNARAHLSLDEKIAKAFEEGFKVEMGFPWQEDLSSHINYLDFCKSFLLQPDLFLRIRPDRKDKVVDALEKANVSFQSESSDCLRLSNTTKVDDLIFLDKDAVVQDLNSQKTLDVLTDVLNATQKIKAWDCCAASGGKSLLLHDQFSNIFILATDIRSSILHNLEKRFEKAGIKNYRSQVHDVAQYSLKEKFDVVICDAPCSGSGTWSRTPEQLYFFKEERIDHYSNLQKKIALNATKSVSQGGYFIYITCSVFKEENEEIVQQIGEKTGMQLVSANYLKGYDKKADTLFTALFRL